VVQVWRLEEEAHPHRLDWGDVDPLRTLEAFRAPLEDVMDHLQMLEASDQNLLEVLEVPQVEMKVR
jgi:hypothetical protein